MTTCGLPVLFVDDDPDNIELFKLQFEHVFAVRTASHGEEALASLAREPIGVLLADEQMPGMTGVDLLAQAVVRWPDTVRVIVSAYSDQPRLLRAINRGHAHEYIVKPWTKAELAACIERGLVIAERRRALIARAEMTELYERDAGEQYDTARVVGANSGLRDVVALAHRAARSDATLLITGETGTGKELIARLVHEASPRSGQPFVRVNCAALAEGVLESELFGHEQGAFTGALRLRKGRFELAHRGTIFLDEVGEISPKVQALLLRVLQEKEIERVGGSSTIQIDVRVLAATHRDLHQLVRAGRFREDLYYRLNVVPLHVPALRDRAADLHPLLHHFLAKHSPRGAAAMPVDPEVYAALESYAWPGNVRELENLVQRALVLAQGPELTVEDFIFGPDEAMGRGSTPDGARSMRDDLKDEERRRIMSALQQCERNQSKA
ncbi:MAG TPA: sigma-54 dependent transcriptional regulator, partial [Kofleriaceae bacterium]|nr:sigma-54 dependent transcriptional regulator [Kofleriaceae bacterium]